MNSNFIKWMFLFVAIAPQCFADERPNILFIIADDASFEHSGANGCSWVNTPNIDQMAKQGINFTSAYTPNPKCSPKNSLTKFRQSPKATVKALSVLFIPVGGTWSRHFSGN